jgi:hypothetical protein
LKDDEQRPRPLGEKPVLQFVDALGVALQVLLRLVLRPDEGRVGGIELG